MPAGRRSTTCCAGRSILNGRRAAAAKRAAVAAGFSKSASAPGCRSTTTTPRPKSPASIISEPMIARAREERRAGAIPYVKELRRMDAHAWRSTRRASFDCVVGAVRHHAGRQSRARAVGMRARGAGPAARSSSSIILYSERGWRRRSSAAGAEGARARPASGISVSSGWPTGRRRTVVPS